MAACAHAPRGWWCSRKGDHPPPCALRARWWNLPGRWWMRGLR